MSEVQGCRVLEIFRSRNFSYDGATTTWAMLDEGDTVRDVILEEVLDLPTPYPLNRDCEGLSGDYHAFITAQQGGQKAARDYANSTSEHLGDDRAVARWVTYHQICSIASDKRFNSRRRPPARS